VIQSGAALRQCANRDKIQYYKKNIYNESFPGYRSCNDAVHTPYSKDQDTLSLHGDARKMVLTVDLEGLGAYRT
jgi:hypothetical protein